MLMQIFEHNAWAGAYIMKIRVTDALLVKVTHQANELMKHSKIKWKFTLNQVNNTSLMKVILVETNNGNRF